MTKGNVENDGRDCGRGGVHAVGREPSRDGAGRSPSAGCAAARGGRTRHEEFHDGLGRSG